MKFAARPHLSLVVGDKHDRQLLIVAVIRGKCLAELVDILLAVVRAVREGLHMHGYSWRCNRGIPSRRSSLSRRRPVDTLSPPKARPLECNGARSLSA